MTSMELRKIPVASVWRTARQTSEKIEAIHIREADNTEEYSKYIMNSNRDIRRCESIMI